MIRFFVSGNPVPLARPRTFWHEAGKRYVTMNPKASEAWKATVQFKAAPYRPKTPIEFPVRLILNFFIPRPKGARQKLWADVRPDLDNYVKGVLDALQRGGFFADDALVVWLEAKKNYSPEGLVGVDISILGIEEKTVKEAKQMGRKITGGMYEPAMWNPCRVRLDFVGRVCGSVPGSKDLVKRWLDSRQPNVRPPSAKSIPEMTEEVINNLPDMGEENAEIEQRTMIVFERVEKKLAVRAATIRAHLKDACSQVQNQLVGRIKGERNFTTRVKNGLYIGGGYRDQNGTEMLFLLRDGKPVSEADGFQERLVHAKTAMGQFSAIKQFEYVIRPSLQFTALLLGNSVKPDDLATILRYGAVHGYGGERSQQEGQYTFEIEVLEGEEAEKIVASAAIVPIADATGLVGVSQNGEEGKK